MTISEVKESRVFATSREMKSVNAATDERSAKKKELGSTDPADPYERSEFIQNGS